MPSSSSLSSATSPVLRSACIGLLSRMQRNHAELYGDAAAFVDPVSTNQFVDFAFADEGQAAEAKAIHIG